MMPVGAAGSGKTTIAGSWPRPSTPSSSRSPPSSPESRDILAAMETAEKELARSGGTPSCSSTMGARFNKAQQDAFLPYVERRPHHLRRRHDPRILPSR